MKPNIIQEAALSLDTLKPKLTINHWEFLRHFLKALISKRDININNPYEFDPTVFKFTAFYVPITRKLIHEVHSRFDKENEKYSDVIYAHRTDFEWAEQVVRLQGRERTTLLCTEVRGKYIKPIPPQLETQSHFYTNGNVLFLLRGTREIAFQNDVYSDSENNGIKWVQRFKIHPNKFNPLFIKVFNKKIEKSEFFRDFFEDFMVDMNKKKLEMNENRKKGILDGYATYDNTIFSAGDIDDYSKEHAVSFVRLMKDIMESPEMVDFFYELYEKSDTRSNSEIFVKNYEVLHAFLFVSYEKNSNIKNDVVDNIKASKMLNLDATKMGGHRFKDFRNYTTAISVFNANGIPYTEIRDLQDWREKKSKYDGVLNAL